MDHVKELFHHAYEVKQEEGRYIPRRFSEWSIDALDRIRPMFKGIARCPVFTVWSP